MRFVFGVLATSVFLIVGCEQREVDSQKLSVYQEAVVQTRWTAKVRDDVSNITVRGNNSNFGFSLTEIGDGSYSVGIVGRSVSFMLSLDHEGIPSLLNVIKDGSIAGTLAIDRADFIGLDKCEQEGEHSDP